MHTCPPTTVMEKLFTSLKTIFSGFIMHGFTVCVCLCVCASVCERETAARRGHLLNLIWSWCVLLPLGSRVCVCVCVRLCLPVDQLAHHAV